MDLVHHMEKELIRNCIKGKRAAQKQMYELYYGRMMGLCMRYAKDRDQAGEILNHGFLKVFDKIKKYDANKGSLDSWICRIMINTSIDYIRKEMKHSAPLISIEDQHNDPAEDEAIIAAMTAEEIIELITKLPPAYKAVFNLYVMEGYSHAEIARELNINIGTSKSNLSKARNKLKQMLEAQGITKSRTHVR